jgi:hypothetical protein
VPKTLSCRGNTSPKHPRYQDIRQPPAKVRSEAAADFPVEFDRPQVPLRLGVGEGHVQVVHEPEDRLAVGLEGSDQVVGLALVVVPFDAGGRVGVGGHAIGDELVVSGGESPLGVGGQRLQAADAGVVAGTVDLHQERGESGRPGGLGGHRGDLGQVP